MHCKQLVSLSVASLMLAAVLTGCGGGSFPPFASAGLLPLLPLLSARKPLLP